MISNERVCVWADGEWCYESELHEMSHRSDDYTVIEIVDIGGEDLDGLQGTHQHGPTVMRDAFWAGAEERAELERRVDAEFEADMAASYEAAQREIMADGPPSFYD